MKLREEKGTYRVKSVGLGAVISSQEEIGSSAVATTVVLLTSLSLFELIAMLLLSLGFSGKKKGLKMETFES
ncbi:hypothetical protein ACFX2I_000609 [Malus domestica]